MMDHQIIVPGLTLLSTEEQGLGGTATSGGDSLAGHTVFSCVHRSSKRDDVDMEELVDDLRGEEERYRERENAREKRRIMARYGKISSWKPSQ